MSTPSKPYDCMEFCKAEINLRRFEALLTISLNAVRVFGVLPSSLNDHPPSEIHVSRFGLFFLRPVKLLYRSAAAEVIGEILKVEGSKKVNAKLRCVKPTA